MSMGMGVSKESSQGDSKRLGKRNHQPKVKQLSSSAQTAKDKVIFGAEEPAESGGSLTSVQIQASLQTKVSSLCAAAQVQRSTNQLQKQSAGRERKAYLQSTEE